MIQQNVIFFIYKFLIQRKSFASNLLTRSFFPQVGVALVSIPFLLMRLWVSLFLSPRYLCLSLSVSFFLPSTCLCRLNFGYGTYRLHSSSFPGVFDYAYTSPTCTRRHRSHFPVRCLSRASTMIFVFGSMASLWHIGKLLAGTISSSCNILYCVTWYQ